MSKIPALAFAAYSGTGKTTLIEKLVRYLKERGLQVAVIKHDSHEIEIDKKGKDSWRFTQAGADISIVSSDKKTAAIEQRSLSFPEVASMVHNVDLIIVEGYKKEPLSQIGMCRESTGKEFPGDLERYVAVVSDKNNLKASVPQFGFEDIQGLAEFIIKNMDTFSRVDIKKNIEALCIDEGKSREEIDFNQNIPSMDIWLKEAKKAVNAEKIGMYLVHNGVVRETAKSKVRFGNTDAQPVTGMLFAYDMDKVNAAIAETYKMDGIYYVRVWLNEGVLQVGDDIMYVMVGGDIRSHVIDALQFLVEKIKAECVTETEMY